MKKIPLRAKERGIFFSGTVFLPAAELFVLTKTHKI